MDRPYQVRKAKGNAVYSVRFTINVNGRSIRREISTKKRNQREATQVAAEIYRTAQAEATNYVASGHSLEDLMLEWIEEVRMVRSIEWAEKCTSYSANWIGRWTKPEQVNSRSLQHYIASRLADGISTVTLHKELSAIRGFCRWCIRQGIMSALPDIVAPQRQSDYRPVALTREQVLAVLSELPDRHMHRTGHPVREYYTVMYEQGLRVGTLARLEWSDVDLVEQTLHIRASADKKRYGRVTDMTAATYAVLSTMEVGDGLIFGRHNYRAALDTAMKRAGIPAELAAQVTAHHTMRHSCLTDMARDPETTLVGLQYVAGHKTLASTQRYLHPAREDARGIMKRRGNHG